MKIKVWASTDIVGSRTEDYLELDDDLTEEEIAEEAYNYIMNFIDWGYCKIS